MLSRRHKDVEPQIWISNTVNSGKIKEKKNNKIIK